MRRTDKHRMEREGRRKGRFHRRLIYEERKTERDEKRKRRPATTFEIEGKKESKSSLKERTKSVCRLPLFNSISFTIGFGILKFNLLVENALLS